MLATESRSSTSLPVFAAELLGLFGFEEEEEGFGFEAPSFASLPVGLCSRGPWELRWDSHLDERMLATRWSCEKRERQRERIVVMVILGWVGG